MDTPRLYEVTQGVYVGRTEHLVGADSLESIRVAGVGSSYKRDAGKSSKKVWDHGSQESFSNGSDCLVVWGFLWE